MIIGRINTNQKSLLLFTFEDTKHSETATLITTYSKLGRKIQMNFSKIFYYYKLGIQLLKEVLLSKNLISLESIGEQKGQVLLSYITIPFQSSSVIDLSIIINKHENIWDCLEMVKIWREHGYTVDIIDYQNNTFKPTKKYDFFIDIHNNLERLAPFMGEKCIKILHITGSHWLHQNFAEYQRLIALKKRRGAVLYPRRLAPPSLGIEYADCATVKCHFNLKTFSYAKKPLYYINKSSLININFNPYKNFSDIKTNFLWLGSSGMILRGLDLLLDAFKEMPDMNLTVCGPVQNEKDFYNFYFKELTSYDNISYKGWVDITSNEFLDLVHSSISFLDPLSCGGIAGSVVVCLHGGLIPIVSRQSGVDVGDFGITLEECGVKEIKQAVRHIAQLPEETLKEMSYKAWSHANNNYSRDHFSKSYQKFVDEIIGKYKGNKDESTL